MNFQLLYIVVILALNRIRMNLFQFVLEESGYPKSNVNVSFTMSTIIYCYLLFYKKKTILELFSNFDTLTGLCKNLVSYTLILTCTFKGGRIDCDDPMKDGVIVTMSCRTYHQKPKREPLRPLTCKNGEWSGRLPRCEPGNLQYQLPID